MATRKKLNTLFAKTEPEPVNQEQQDTGSPSNAAPFQKVPIPGLEEYVTPETQPAADTKKKTTSAKQKPQSVYLNESELKYIQEIADEYGETRHSVMQYAVKELIREWKRGKKPRVNNLGKLDK